MKSRWLPVFRISAVVLLGYFAAYFLSVQTSHVVSKRGEICALPVYIPVHSRLVSAVFAPAHFLDATCFRPARWETQVIFGGDGLF
jgi:hypothetical protein